MKKIEVQGRVYTDKISNRSPIMVCIGKRICSLETLLKEADLFEQITHRTEMKKYFYSQNEFKVDCKITQADVEAQIKPVKITVIIEEI